MIFVTLSFSSASNALWPLGVKMSMPLTTCSLGDSGHCAASAVRGRFVRAVTDAKVSGVG